MCYDKVLANPHNKMVLECPLDDLMKQIGAKQLVNVSTRESGSKRLDEDSSDDAE